MNITILSLFPEGFSVFDTSIIKRAKDKGIVSINIRNLRDWATDTYKSVDDKPYGGGAGMILRVDLIDQAISDIKRVHHNNNSETKVVLTDATGKKYSQVVAKKMSTYSDMIIICGHYEGVDHRIHEHIADEIISIGDYVLSGGEIAAMVLVDSVVRLLPNALGNSQSLIEESHNEDGVEYPQYTRPEVYKSWKVPEILLSGNHKKIVAWRESTRA